MKLATKPLNYCALTILATAMTIEPVKAEVLWDDLPKQLSVNNHLMAQSPTPIGVTAINFKPTETGLEIIVETLSGEKLQPLIFPQDNVLVIDIPDAVLTIANPEELKTENPTEAITEIAVTQLDPSLIRITVTGKVEAPTAEVVPSEDNLVLSLTTSQEIAKPQGELEVVATTERQQEDNYFVNDTSTATRTETPILDIPQSIQVVPEQLIQDRKVDNVGDALETVSGVNNQGSFSGYEEAISIRGFVVDTFQGNYFRDGLRVFTFGFSDLANVQSIEVLKGPASVLYGQVQPGGIVNFVTKKPLSEPYYAINGTIGNFDTYWTTADLTGPLNEDKTLLYRLNIAYRSANSFRDFVDSSRVFIAPVLTWNISPNTSLTFSLDYLYDDRTMDDGIVAIGDRPADVPISRFFNEPFSNFNKDELSLGYAFEHRFSDNWKIKNAFRAQFIYPERYYPLLDAVDEATGEIFRTAYYAAGFYENYVMQTDLIGKFTTGSIPHEILFGLEYNKTNEQPDFGFDSYPSINLFNPIYINERYPKKAIFFRDDITTTVGLYIQDQIKFLPNLILLIGGRYDYFSQDRSTQDLGAEKQTFQQSDSDFSPRVGLVYKPVDNVALYASYSRSFRPTFGTFRNFDESSFEPETGTQYEVGVKSELFERRVGMSLAAFYITKQNVVTADPNDPLFSIQTGEQTSKGIEFEIAGEIIPGWRLTASATYLDARITEDNVLIVGNWLDNVPEFTANLWSTYEIQNGDLQGLGVGLGLFYVGDRYGDLDNSFTLPSYFRTDAALYYQRDNWKAQLNIRNLFDIRYFSGASFGSRVNVQPGEPFTVLGTISVEF